MRLSIALCCATIALGAMISPCIGQNLPDAPTPQPKPSVRWHDIHPADHKNWFARHPVAFTWIALGAGIGTPLIWHFTHSDACPNFYEGKPYTGYPCHNGTPPEVSGHR